MKNTYYKPEVVDAIEFSSIVKKLRSDLEELLNGKVSKVEVVEYVKKLIGDGVVFEWNKEAMFWALDDPRNMPSDAQTDFLYIPTYIAVSIMANAYMYMPEEIVKLDGFMDAFKLGLNGAAGREFKGHGFDSLSGLMECIGLFLNSNMYEFITLYPNICTGFTKNFLNAIYFIKTNVKDNSLGSGLDSVGESCIKPILHMIHIKEKISKVFVYGTLLNENCNHDYYLKDSMFVGNAILKGYSLYNLDSYPGIKKCENDYVKGEVYIVDEDTLGRLNYLEDEGELYSLEKESVQIQDILIEDVGVYVYLHDVKKSNYVKPELQPWKMIKII